MGFEVWFNFWSLAKPHCGFGLGWFVSVPVRCGFSGVGIGLG